MHSASLPTFLHCRQGCTRSHFNFLRLHSRQDFVARARLRMESGFRGVAVGVPAVVAVAVAVAVADVVAVEFGVVGAGGADILISIFGFGVSIA